jgi:hypothetical protein
MRVLRTTLIATLFCLPALAQFAGCGSTMPPDADPFDTYQLCFTEHHVTEAFRADQTITICCLSHPIGTNAANVVCGATASTCTTYVTANIMTTDATSAEITTGCNDYITQRGM